MLGVYTKQSDISVICIDQSDLESLKKAEKYAEHIRREKGDDAQIIIAITKTDQPVMKEFEEKIKTFKEKYKITAEPVKTSAKTEGSIEQLRDRIFDLEMEIGAKKTEDEIPDSTFIKAFKSSFLDYLRKPLDPSSKLQNQPSKVIALDDEFAQLNQEIETVTRSEVEIPKGEKQKLYSRIQAFQHKVDNFFNAKVLEFTQNVIVPINIMATNLNMTRLDKSKREDSSYDEVSKKTTSFLGIANAAVSYLEANYRKKIWGMKRHSKVLALLACSYRSCLVW